MDKKCGKEFGTWNGGMSVSFVRGKRTAHWNEHVFQRRESITYRLETREGMGRANGLY